MKKHLLFIALSFILSLQGSMVSGQNVLFVTDTLSKDQAHWYVLNYCLDNGYSLTISNKVSESNFQELYNDADIVLISAQTSSSSSDAFVKVSGLNPIKPLVVWKTSWIEKFQLTKGRGWNDKSGYKMIINENEKNHPLSAGYSDTIFVYDFPQGIEVTTGPNDRNTNAYSLDMIPDSAIVIGKVKWSDGTLGVTYFAFDKGTAINDSTKAGSRIVAFYFTPWTHPETCVYNEVTDKMWDAAFNWALDNPTTAVKRPVIAPEINYTIQANQIKWQERGERKVYVYDITGRLIIPGKMLNSNILDLSSLNNGLYIISAMDIKSQKVSSFKFMKQ